MAVILGISCLGAFYSLAVSCPSSPIWRVMNRPGVSVPLRWSNAAEATGSSTMERVSILAWPAGLRPEPGRAPPWVLGVFFMSGCLLLGESFNASGEILDHNGNIHGVHFARPWIPFAICGEGI